jgi:hypothetical protein
MEPDMDVLFLLGQVFFLAGLAWGALICLHWHDEDDAEASRGDNRRSIERSASRSY